MSYKQTTGNYKRRNPNTSFQKTEIIKNANVTLIATDLNSPTMNVGKSYICEIYVLLNSGTTPDSKLALDQTTSLGATLALWGLDSAYATPFATTIQVDGAGANALQKINVLVINVTTAGSIKIQFAQQTSDASNSKFMIGSCMSVVEL